MARSVKKVVLGEVAVDSGHLMVIDPLYLYRLEQAAHAAGKSVSEVALDVAYECASRKGLGGQVDFPSGVSGMAVAFQSGIGDGVYPVVGHIRDLSGWGKRLVKVEIVLRHPVVR
ncbi:MAG: hypothetical protein ACPLQP_00915 [Moorellaceae bacterium]